MHEFELNSTFFVFSLSKDTEEKYRQRPSREEDVLYINQLQEKLRKQELVCQKLNDEKKYYKLELVNREENFNKVFSNSPKVGLFQSGAYKGVICSLAFLRGQVYNYAEMMHESRELLGLIEDIQDLDKDLFS